MRRKIALVALLLSLALASSLPGCAQGGQPGANDPAGAGEVRGSDRTDAREADGSVSPGHESRIARIEANLLPTFTIRGEPVRSVSLAERMDELSVPGVSVAVFQDGEIVWARGWGFADVASGRSVTADTLFQAASISKPVAAVAALKMVEQGALRLDDDVNDHLTSWNVPGNEFTAVHKVTLRGLLNHTAGTTVWGFPGYGPGEEVPSTVGVLEGKGNTDPVRVFKEPGESWRYSGGGYTVMQQMLSDLAGKPFAELMRELVLEPTGMSRSTYEQPLPEERRNDAATGYRPDGSIVDGNYHTYPEQAAAGLWTTPSDLARFAMAIQRSHRGFNRALLSAATARAMLRPGLNDHGLGPGIQGGGVRFGHGGSNEGFRCQLTAFVDGSGGVAVMTNSDNGSPLVQQIILTVAAEYGWPGLEPEEKVTVTLTPEQYERLTGVYDFPDVGQARIRDENGNLWISYPGADMELLAESPTSFFVRESGQPASFEIEGDEVVLVWFGARGTRISGLR